MQCGEDLYMSHTGVRWFGCSVLTALLLLLTNSGGGGSSSPPPTPTPSVAVSVSPNSTILQTGGSVTLTGTVLNSTNQNVSWSVNGISGGNSSVGVITSAGIYTSPAQVADTTDFTIAATSVADNTKSATAIVTVFAAPRISVRIANGAGEFYDRSTGAQFIPRGNNYLRFQAHALAPPVSATTVWHSTLSVGLYAPDNVEAAFTAMETYGYNLVKVWMDCCGATTGLGNPNGDGLNTLYVANLADFMRRAKAHHIYVIPTLDDLPKVGGYQQIIDSSCVLAWPACGNLEYTTTGGISADRKFWQDFIRALVAQKAPMDAIFAYQLREEFYYPPASQAVLWATLPLLPTSGMFTAVNGQTYDMSDPAARQQLMNDSLIFWTNNTRTAIQELAPGAGVGVGFVTNVNPTVPPFPVIAASTADFIDGHTGPGMGTTLEEDMDGWGKPPGPSAKPVMIGEMAASLASFSLESDAAAALKQWQVDSCQFFINGWMLWTWDTAEQDSMGFAHWYAVRGSGLVGQTLAPATRPDPCVD